ncbi:MAG TPA: GGDEF domain-containing protein [Thermohalobaculum sp.]|nr:GGDEF domain-containing protein [Thermohalobaculum sp.]
MNDKSDLQIRILRMLLVLMAVVAVTSGGVHLAVQSRLDAVPAAAAPSMYALLNLQTWLQAALVGGLLVLIGYFVLLPVARRVDESRKEAAQQEAALEHARSHDNLTGFLDGPSFEQLLEHTGAVGRRHNHAVGLLRLRMTGVRGSKSRLDFGAADELVTTVARRIGETIRAADRPARLGDAEFAILVPKVKSVDGLGRLAERLIEDLNEAIGEERQQTVGFAIGIAVAWPTENAAVDDLLARSVEALEESRGADGSAWRYHPSAVQGMSDRMAATG